MPEISLFANLPEKLRDDIHSGLSRAVCPRCAGGSSQEQSLSIRQDAMGVLRLKCFRASCGWFGVSVTDHNDKLQSRRDFKPSFYRTPTIPIQGVIQDLLVNDYGCTLSLARSHGWRLSASSAELVMSIRDYYGLERGHVTRTFTKPKKCYTFKAIAQPWLDHWPTTSRHTVVVEDCISALRLRGIGYNAVSLLGTNLTLDQAKEINEHYGHGKIWLALDLDAFAKSLRLSKQHSHILTMHPVCLTEDIKNTQHDEDIVKLFGGP